MGWQDIVAIAAVIGAVGYLVSIVWSGVAGERKAAGDACGKCAGSSSKPVEIAAFGPAKESRPG